MNPTQDLWIAIERGDIEKVRFALKNGADVHAIDEDDLRRDALLFALCSVKPVNTNEICEVLLRAGANVKRRCADGQTALYWATVGAHENIVRTLIKHGAKVSDEQPEDGVSSLHWAAGNGQLQIVQLLLEVGGRSVLNKFDILAHTPLMCAAENNHFEIAELLIEAGSDVNAFDKPNIGDTALHHIAQTGSYEMVKLLIDAGADPTIPGWMQITALDQARERVEKSKKPSAEAIANLKMIEEAARRVT